MLKSEYIDYVDDAGDFSGDDFEIPDLNDYIKSMKRFRKHKVKEIYIAS